MREIPTFSQQNPADCAAGDFPTDHLVELRLGTLEETWLDPDGNVCATSPRQCSASPMQHADAALAHAPNLVGGPRDMAAAVGGGGDAVAD